MIGLILLTAGAFALIRGRKSVGVGNTTKNQTKGQLYNQSSNQNNKEPEESKQ